MSISIRYRNIVSNEVPVPSYSKDTDIFKKAFDVKTVIKHATLENGGSVVDGDPIDTQYYWDSEKSALCGQVFSGSDKEISEWFQAQFDKAISKGNKTIRNYLDRNSHEKALRITARDLFRQYMIYDGGVYVTPSSAPMYDIRWGTHTDFFHKPLTAAPYIVVAGKDKERIQFQFRWDEAPLIVPYLAKIAGKSLFMEDANRTVPIEPIDFGDIQNQLEVLSIIPDEDFDENLGIPTRDVRMMNWLEESVRKILRDNFNCADEDKVFLAIRNIVEKNGGLNFYTDLDKNPSILEQIRSIL